MPQQQDENILLETGTNEVQFLEFNIGKRCYGINVLKIKQLIQFSSDEIVELPSSHQSVKGSIIFQGQSIPVIDLRRYLGYSEDDALSDRRFQVVLICEFNHNVNGFFIDHVNKMHRISWDDIQVQGYTKANDDSRINGIVHIDKRQVLLLDFESIIADIFGSVITDSNDPTIQADGDTLNSRKQIKILAADDSKLIQNKVVGSLKSAGYEQVLMYDNGQDLLDAFTRLHSDAKHKGQSINDSVNLVLTDIEMPRLDGLSLCKQIKQLSPKTPVIILSSMITDQMIDKCKSVLADGYLSKEHFPELISQIDRQCNIE